MARSSERQAGIESKRAQAVVEHPLLWSKMIADWQRPVREDRAWLLYAANYLFQTGGVRWALDPLTLAQRVPEAQPVEVARDLAGLSLILLSHRHSDHFNPMLVRTLSGLPALWIVPAPLLPLAEDAGLPRRKIIVPRPLEPVDVAGLRITAFDGLHWEADTSRPDGLRGVPATGYLVEFDGKRWLFPGDTRTYDASRLPDFGPLDVLFAHLWLGRAAALHSPPPLLADFCRFCLGFQARRVILTHLYEWGRQADELWDLGHAQHVAATLAGLRPSLLVESACTYDSIYL